VGLPVTLTKKKPPEVFKKDWVPVRGSQPQEFSIHGRNGWRFEYEEGSLEEVSLPNGVSFQVDSDGPRITRIQQKGAEVPLLEATYTDLGHIESLQVGQRSQT
jgi:hypothetical protein